MRLGLIISFALFIMLSCSEFDQKQYAIIDQLGTDLDKRIATLRQKNIGQFVKMHHVVWHRGGRKSDVELLEIVYDIRSKSDSLISIILSFDFEKSEEADLIKQIKSYTNELSQLVNPEPPKIVIDEIYDFISGSHVYRYDEFEILKSSGILRNIKLKQLALKVLQFEQELMYDHIQQIGTGCYWEWIQVAFIPEQRIIALADQHPLRKMIPTRLYLYLDENIVYVRSLKLNGKPLPYDSFDNKITSTLEYGNHDGLMERKDLRFELEVWTQEGKDSAIVINKNVWLARQCTE